MVAYSMRVGHAAAGTADLVPKHGRGGGAAASMECEARAQYGHLKEGLRQHGEQLYEEARRRGVKGCSKMSKAQLERAVRR
jgi:hypothetical protein